MKNKEYFVISNTCIPKNFKIVNYNSFVSQVKAIEFQDCNLTELPRPTILLDFIKDLTYLMINGCNLPKVSREDFRGLNCLKVLNLRFNNIETLPRGLFAYTPKLECISFPNNKIREIDQDILDPLQFLTFFDLTGNAEINVKYDAVHNEGNVTLEQLREKIQKCDPNEKFKVEMRAKLEAVNAEVTMLNEANIYLTTKCLKLERDLDKQTLEINKLKGKGDKDFTVIINGKALRVDKKILAANSPVLAKMLNKNENVEQMELQDLSEETFKHILKYMSDKNPPSNAANQVELYAASARLEMKELMDLTAEALEKKIKLENANDIMKLAMKFGHEKLRRKAFSVLRMSFGEGK